MIGLIWNCRGLGKKGISSHLAGLLKDRQVDFVGIQETMKKDFLARFFKRFDWQGKFQWHWLPSVGKSVEILGGVNSERFQVKTSSVGRFHIKLQIYDLKEKMDLYLAFVYGAAQEELKDEFLAELAQLCADQSFPLLIGGDFNIIICVGEKNKSVHLSRHSRNFSSIINSFEFRELPLTGG